MSISKKDLSRILNEISTLMEIKGENPFKSRAYMMAARTILSQSADPEQLVASGELGNLKGIGSVLVEKITILVTTGKLDYYEELKASVPQGLVEMTAIPGFGPKKVRKVHEALGIQSVGELEYACRENRLLDLEGFGAKTQEKILQGIEFLKKHRDRHLFHQAETAAVTLLQSLQNHPKVLRAEIAGSLRRKKETIKDIDIVASVAPEDVDEVMRFFVSLPGVEAITGQGSTKSSVTLEQGISADLRLMPDGKFPYILHHFTGSAEHNTALRGRAKKRGMKVSEHGLFRGEDELIACKDETELYAALGLAYIPPELREDQGEIEAAAENRIPRLIEPEDIRGILHCHSTFSDGANTVAEMANAVKAMGCEYFGLCDHSQVAVYARGLQPERVKEQHAVVDELNRQFSDFKILKGTECDILNDGSLDYDEEVLATFDFVVASVHSNLRMSAEDANNRLLNAIRNRYVNIIGHPTGRLLLGREGLPLDMHRLLDAAAEKGVAIELNANPHRFDIDWRYGKYAKERGVMISINPDAHSVEGLADMRYGVGIARKGWLEKTNVLNTLPLAEIERFFTERRERG